MRRLTLPLACLALLALGDATAHGGGLNKHGCHNDRKNGGYHCHRGPSASPPTQQYARRPRQFERQQFNPQPTHRLDTPLDFSPSAPPRNGGAFRNCDAARAAGAAPVRRGEPGYGPHLDRDGDGIGCEPYRGR